MKSNIKKSKTRIKEFCRACNTHRELDLGLLISTRLSAI